MSLSLTNISKSVDNKSVLRNVSFVVEEGEVFGVFGASGSGKSTLIDIIAGKQHPSSGIVEHNGVDVTKLTFNDRHFHLPALTGRTNWRMLFRADNRCVQSDGEGQRIALNAVFEDAENVLLLDNSFCNMDKSMRNQSFEKLRSVAKARRIAVIFASNDYEEMLLACDRVAILVDGEVKQIGVPQEVYEFPKHAAVARAVECDNFFFARRLTSSKAELPEYQTIDGEHRLFTRKVQFKEIAPLNQNVTLAIRPEHISIAFGASFPEDNLLKATVTQIRFLGPTTLVEFDSDGLRLQAMVLRVVGLKLGDECMIGLPPDRIQIFKD